MSRINYNVYNFSFTGDQSEVAVVAAVEELMVWSTKTTFLALQNRRYFYKKKQHIFTIHLYLNRKNIKCL